MSRSCVLYLVRHGTAQCEVGASPQFPGQRAAWRLTQDGHTQSQRLSPVLTTARPTTVYTSPVLAAVQTAQHIADGLDTLSEVRLRSALLPPAGGQWEGQRWQAIADNGGEAYRLFQCNPAACVFPEGEALHAVQHRAVDCVQRIMCAHLDQRVVLVTHDWVCRLVTLDAMRVSLASFHETRLEPGTMGVLRLVDDCVSLTTLAVDPAESILGV